MKTKNKNQFCKEFFNDFSNNKKKATEIKVSFRTSGIVTLKINNSATVIMN